ncbi:MAG: cyclic nucleotide-binding protein [Polaromonas sp.]|nr:cyclic nucleotide-binding protein [Polaromonas sp.]
MSTVAESEAAILGLRRVKLLAGLNDEALERVARVCAWRRYEAGKALITRSSPSRDVFIVVSGRVRVTVYTASGRQVTFRDLAEGETFGEIAAIDGGPRSVDVLTLTEVLVAVLTPADLNALMRENPLVAEQFTRHLVQLIRLLTETVIELSTLGVVNRIHAELLRLAVEAGAGSTGSCVLSPAPRHADIAARVSTTREQVSREISVQTKQGLLVKHPEGMLISDVHALGCMVERASRDA